MRVRKKTYRRKVTALVDATPAFVSVVNRGASGSPFTCVKQEDSPMKMKRRSAAPVKQAAKKSNKAVNTPEKRKSVADAVQNRETIITKFVFDKEHFATVEDVQKFMDNSDFEGEMEFVDEETTITVLNKDAADMTLIKTDEIETGEEGVVAEVGAYLVEEAETVAKSDDPDEDDEDDDSDDDADDEADEEGDEDESDDDDSDEGTEVENSYNDKKKPTKKDDAPAASEAAGSETTLTKRQQFLASLAKADAETAKKFDYYEVWVENNDTSFANLLKQGMKDGAAPGFDEVMWTFGQAVRKSLNSSGEGLEEQLRKDAGSLITLVLAQNALFESIIDSEAEDVQKAQAPHSYEVLKKWATDFGKALLDDGNDARASVTKGDKASRNNAVIADSSVEDVVHKHVTPIVETVKQLAKTVDKIASRRQVSKSVPTPDLSKDEGANPADDKKDTVSKQAADEFGSVVFGR